MNYLNHLFEVSVGCLIGAGRILATLFIFLFIGIYDVMFPITFTLICVVFAPLGLIHCLSSKGGKELKWELNKTFENIVRYLGQHFFNEEEPFKYGLTNVAMLGSTEAMIFGLVILYHLILTAEI